MKLSQRQDTLSQTTTRLMILLKVIDNLLTEFGKYGIMPAGDYQWSKVDSRKDILKLQSIKVK